MMSVHDNVSEIDGIDAFPDTPALDIRRWLGESPRPTCARALNAESVPPPG